MPDALMAGFWGAVAGSALFVGALIALYAHASRRVISLVMAIGGGVLISLVAFNLMDEAYARGGLEASALGMLLGAAVFFAADTVLSRRGAKNRKRSHGHPKDEGSGIAIFVGSMLDSIPEAVAIGVSMLGSGAVGWVMVAGIFLSNVPEGLSATAGMHEAGRSKTYVFALWAAAVACTALGAFCGYQFLAGASANLISAIQAFAAGAVLAMLASTMLPEAFAEGGPAVGFLTAIGFLAAFALEKIGQH